MENIQKSTFCNENIIEKLDTDIELRDIIIKSLKEVRYQLVYYIKAINKNDNYPEYKNLKITNLKSKYCLVYTKDKWVTTIKDKALSDLISVRICEIQNILTKDYCIISKDKIKNIKDEIQFCYDNELNDYDKEIKRRYPLAIKKKINYLKNLLKKLNLILN